MFLITELSPKQHEATRAIYNYYITNTNSTPETEERTLEQYEQFVGAFLFSSVACEGERVVGFAFVKPYARGLESFDPAVEIGVYMHSGSLRRGGGMDLVRRVLSWGKLNQKHTAIAKIDGNNAASVALFAKLGFQEAARLREIGFKNGVRVTVVYMQLMFSSWSTA
jgi:phosphinothricin acetyltransferase